MKIEHSKIFTLYGIEGERDILVPREDGSEVATEFIKSYNEKFFDQAIFPITITIALCALEETEKWSTVSKAIKEEGWAGASLALWRLYISDKNVQVNTVSLPGVRYRDDNFVEWVPIVHFCARILFKNATEISMRLSTTLDLPKPRIVLVSKIDEPGGSRLGHS